MLDRLVKLEDLRLKGIAKDPNASAEARKAAVKQQAKLSKAYQSGGVIRRGKLINQLIEVMGETRLATNVTVAKIGAAARTVNMLSRMGLSGIAAVNDAGMAMHIQRSWGMKAADRYSGVVKDYFKRYKGDMRRFAKEHGFLMEMVLGDAMNRLDAGRENLGKGLSWITNFFYKVNGLTYLTQQKQVAMAIALSHHIGYNIKGMSWDSILPQVRGGLEFHGIGQDKLPLLQGMLEEIGDRTFLNATLARNLTNEQLDEFLPPLYRQDPKRGKRMSDEEYADVLEAWEQQKDTERARLRGSLETSVLSLFADDARYGAMEPDAAARAFMYRGTEGGDYTGEALRGVWQFKSFPLMVWQRHLKGRSWQKFGSDGRITEDIPGAIHMITWLTGMGLLTNTLRDLASGKEPKDPRKVATWLEAIKMGGAGGILGDMLLQQNPERGGAISNFVMGPSLQTAEDIIDTAAQLVQGEFGAAGKTALGVVTDNIPFKNFWATKAAMDYYLFHSAKMTNNPNYIKNSERQMNENFNQGYWMY
jgi:hypothetical protein